MNPTARNGWIDVLRALSALAVVLFHLNRIPVMIPPDSLSRWWHAIWSHGHWGVGVFFALSGYCLFPGWSRATGALDFIFRRGRRIFPPYWCSLLLIAGLILCVKLVTGVNDVAKLPASAHAVAATLLLLSAPVTATPTINWVYWTLSYVVAFYLLAGLVLFWPRATRIQALAGLHGLLCAVDFVFHPAPVGPLFFIKHWPVFGLGLALAVFAQHRRTGRVMLLTSLLHAIWLVSTGADDTHYLAVGVVAAVFLALSQPWSFPSWLRPLAWIGEISYSLYLVHVPIGIYGLMRFFPGKFTMPFTYVGAQLLLLGGIVAFACLFHLVGERPFLPRSRSGAIPATGQTA